MQLDWFAYISKVGYGGYVGLKINDNFAFEAGAHSLGKFNVAGTDVKDTGTFGVGLQYGF